MEQRCSSPWRLLVAQLAAREGRERPRVTGLPARNRQPLCCSSLRHHSDIMMVPVRRSFF